MAWQIQIIQVQIQSQIQQYRVAVQLACLARRDTLNARAALFALHTHPRHPIFTIIIVLLNEVTFWNSHFSRNLMQLTKVKPLKATHTTYRANPLQHNYTQLISLFSRVVPTFQDNLVIQRSGCNQTRRIRFSFHTERGFRKACCIHQKYTMLSMCALFCVLCVLACVLCVHAFHPVSGISQTSLPCLIRDS